jgi:hypothetical protein
MMHCHTLPGTCQKENALSRSVRYVSELLKRLQCHTRSGTCQKGNALSQSVRYMSQREYTVTLGLVHVRKRMHCHTVRCVSAREYTVTLCQARVRKRLHCHSRSDTCQKENTLSYSVRYVSEPLNPELNRNRPKILDRK